MILVHTHLVDPFKDVLLVLVTRLVLRVKRSRLSAAVRTDRPDNFNLDSIGFTPLFKARFHRFVIAGVLDLFPKANRDIQTMATSSIKTTLLFLL